MAKVLYISANPSVEQHSYSLSVGRAFLNAYRGANPHDEIVELDVYNKYIPLIDSDVLTAWDSLRSGGSFESLTTGQRRKVEAFNDLTDQFIRSDKYIFVTPMWNLSIPPMMKAYIDTVVIAGKTFKYTEQGPVGLLQGKKGIHIQARGGFYSGDHSAFEFGDSYIKTIMSFIGLDMMESIVSEGMAYDPSKADSIKQAAIAVGEQAAAVLALA